MRARYLTTTLPYVNASPHMGHVLEFVQADVLARTWRAAGDDVFFSIGTDEHGQKIYEAAGEARQTTKEYVDHYAAEFQRLKQLLNLSNDAFIRTTSHAHIAAAQEMWRRCDANGDIYKKTYTGLYCVGCESFKTDKELVDGKCSLHPTLVPEKVAEENYFFKFSDYEKKLLHYLEKEGSIIPEWRKTEAIAFVKGGLEDFSISREKKRLSWGIPVPGDDAQVMYVWFDALTNYISTLGWPDDEQRNFKKFWEEGETLQVAGKDQVRFQSLMWQAMLMSAEIKTTDTVFYHGFITSGGQKMSKSLGNVINPLELVEKYGTDAVRYILLRHVSPTEDSDLTLDAIHDHYTAHLTNGLGNFVARVMKLSEEHLTSAEIANYPKEVKEVEVLRKFNESINNFNFNKALDIVWKDISEGDELINKKRPFDLIKTNVEEGKEIIRDFVWRVSRIAGLLALVMPNTARIISDAVRANKKPENLFPRL